MVLQENWRAQFDGSEMPQIRRYAAFNPSFDSIGSMCATFPAKCKRRYKSHGSYMSLELFKSQQNVLHDKWDLPT